MKGLILYTSRYGATRRYAGWLAEETGFDLRETKDALLEDVLPCDTIILGGGLYASGIAGLGFLRKHIGALRGKKVIVFCDGVSPYDEAAFRQITAHNLTGELAGLPCFYCRGAWDFDGLSFVHKSLCRMLLKAASRKKPEDCDVLEAALCEAGTGKRDWTNRRYLEPILAALR